jgi:large subunit ribosomal protein L24
VDATIDADDSAQMFRIIGLDRAAVTAKGPGKFTLNAQGPLDGAIKLNSRMTSAEGLDGRMQGTMQFSSEAGVSGQFDLAMGNVDLSWLRSSLVSPADRLTAALTSRVSVTGRKFKFENAMASVAGTPLRGKLDMDFTSVPRITGQIDADMIDAAAVIGSIAGFPLARADGASSWPTEPFTAGYFGITGRIAVSAAQANIGPYLVKDLRTSLRLEPSGLTAEAIEGEVADGKLSGEISLRKATEGLNLKARLGLQNVDARIALPLENNPFSGRLGLQFDVEGVGLSPKALVGSLAGNGTVSLERASVSGLDPRVFPTVMRAADRGLLLEPGKIRDAVTPWIDSGALEIAHADGVIAIAGGQVRLPTLIARAKGADVSASGNLDLVNSALDARVALTGTANVASSRPEIVIQLRGPLNAPKRNVDVASLAGWLALRAVDQQSKTLEAIEQGRGNARDPAMTIPDSEIIPDAPAPDRNIILPRPRVKAPEAPPAQRPAALDRASPLPPPLDIGPAPGARRPLPTRPQAISPPAERNTF